MHSSSLGQQSIALLALALAGASLGFLPHNFHPARIFLGGGAYLLGYLLGTLSIIGGTKGATLLLVLGIPILDTAWQILRRLRRGRSPMEGERGHLHHRLFDLGLSQPRVVADLLRRVDRLWRAGPGPALRAGEADRPGGHGGAAGGRS